MQSFNLRTDKRAQLVDITARISDAVRNAGVQQGLCSVYVPHTTAGITINEAADPSVKHDILTELDKIVPWNHGYTHMEGNSAAHIKASLMGSSVSIPIEVGRLALGTWQGIYFCEFDGPRNRAVSFTILEAK